jgi:hypothetical protein
MWKSLFTLFIVLTLCSCSKDEILLDKEISSSQEKNTSPGLEVEPAYYYLNLFDRNGGGWTGSDGTYSLPLPDGRVLWSFGDTFLGTVNPDYSRPFSGLINNSFMIQDGSNMITYHGGTTENPEAYVKPSNPDYFYWPGDATVIGDRVLMYMQIIHLTGAGGAFGFEHLGADVAIFQLPSFELISLLPYELSTDILPGVSIYEEGQYIYSYATRSVNGKNTLVSRVHISDPSSEEFWNGTEWQSSRVINAYMKLDNGQNLKTSNMFTVFKYGGKYRLVTQADYLGRRIFVYSGNSPMGPWGNRQVIYTTPETAGDIWTYNAYAHPHIIHPEKGILISYNVNSFDFLGLFEDARIYRPRFIWVKPVND